MHRRYLVAQPILLLLFAGAPRSAGAAATQANVLERGVLVLMRGSTVIAREEFVVRRARTAGAAHGYTVTSTVYYPPARPRRTLTAVVEFGPDSQPAAAQFDVQDDDLRRVLIRFGPRRVTVRIVTPGGESAREYPGSPRYVLLDDSLFAHYAIPPAPARRVRGISTRGGRSQMLQITDQGMRPTWVAGVERRLRQVSLGSGEHIRHLWYDERGRLVKVAVPQLDLVAYRATSPPR